jgi:uncharacterized protein YjbI with pentapeptide repeats
MARGDDPHPPDLPELEARPLLDVDADHELTLSGVLVDGEGLDAIVARRIDIEESELRGVTLAAAKMPGLQLSDVILRDCDFSNVHGRGGAITRTEIHQSRFVGFDISEGRVDDLRVTNASMTLASFARAGLQSVIFDRVNLAEASFMDARMKAVAFVNCNLVGADFRGARIQGCAIRGSSLDGIVGIESLRGLTMPWPDLLESAGALAAAAGIEAEED